MTELNTVQEQRSKNQNVDWEDRYKRLVAELDNTQKRLARNSSQAVERKQDQLLLEMLPFVDNLERILSNQADSPRCSQLLDGIRVTYRDFQNALRRHGVEPIEALNRPFDPNIHEATAMVEHPSYPEGVVIEVIQSGYLRDGRLLRPAQVIVSAD
jgi:molecular chaperone GrpE